MTPKAMLTAVALVLTASGMVPATASAQYHGGGRYERADRDSDPRGGDNRGYNRRPDRRGYDDRGYGDRGYDRRRYRSDRCGSATGTILGAIAGGLLGNSVAGRGDRGVGTVFGAGAGALTGRAIDRSDNPRACR